VRTLKVADKWVTHVAFSSWALVEPGICELVAFLIGLSETDIIHDDVSLGEAYVAYGVSDGAIGLVKVTHALIPVPSAFGAEYTLDTRFEDQNDTEPCAADKRGITALVWVDVPGRNVSISPRSLLTLTIFVSSESSSIANPASCTCGLRRR
jgi:general transcription factor 3C polypeptide 4